MSFTEENAATEMQKTFLTKLSAITLGRPTTDCAPVTGQELIEFLKSEHFHEKIIATAKANKTLTTPHNEDLLTHLLSAGEICQEYATANHLFQGKEWLGMNIGFWHDIGKPGCTTQLSKRLSMKFHGVVGGALIENLLNTDEFKAVFGLTETDISVISSAADVHMCGYFPDQGQQHGDTHMDTLRLLPKDVRAAVACLRLGDQLGMKHRDMGPEEVEALTNDLKASQGRYLEDILTDLAGDDYAVHHARDRGCLIHVNGISGAGKSTLARNMMADLKRLGARRPGGVAAFQLSRDDYIMAVTREKMTAAGIINEDECLGYREAYAYYEHNKSSLAGEVNRRMNKRMEELLNSRHIVITDTMATMWPSRDTITSANAIDAFRLSIWVHSNADLPEVHHDMDQSKQREVNKNVMPSKWNPIASGLQWRDLTSLLEHRVGEMDKKSTVVLKPHLALSYGRSGMKGSLIEHVLRKVMEMNAYWTRILRCPLLEETRHMNLEGLIRTLYDQGEDNLNSFFKAHNYKVKTEVIDEVSFITVKYVDGCNRLWSEQWMKEARGRTVAVMEKVTDTDPDYADDLSFGCVAVTVKSQHERSPELLTASHFDQGVKDTQDISAGQTDLSHLCSETQRLSQLVNSIDEFEEPVLVCDKVDGCTGIITFISEAIQPESPSATDLDILTSRVAEIVRASKWNVSVKVGDESYIATMSSSGVFGLNKTMKAYFLTSLIQACKGSGDCPDQIVRSYLACERRVKEAETEEDLDSAWIDDGSVVFKYWLEEYINQASHQPAWEETWGSFKWGREIWCCMTEMVCANRRSYSGDVFTCLATSYDHGGIYVLGEWIPDMYIPSTDQESKGMIRYPASRMVSDQAQLMALMRSIMDYTVPQAPHQRRMDQVMDYVARHPESEAKDRERQFTTSLRSRATGATIKHYEGYVAYSMLDCESGSYPVAKASGKIKTPDFYKLHKWQKYGINVALGMPVEMDSIYPIVGQLKKLMVSQGCECDNTATDLMYDLLGEVTEHTDEVKSSLPEKARPRVDAYLSGSRNEKDAGMLLKVIANMMTPAMQAKAAQRTRAMMEKMGCPDEALHDDEKMANLGKKLLMVAEPWVNKAGTGKLSARFPEWREWRMAGRKADQKLSREDQLLNEVFEMATSV